MKCLAPLLILTSTTLMASEPKAVINGPSEARQGDLIILDALESTADHVSWLVDTSDVDVPNGTDVKQAEQMAANLRRMGWEVAEPVNGSTTLYAIRDAGRELFLASHPGTYRIVLAVSVDGVGIHQKAWRVYVSRIGEPPRPPDDPDVPDVPDIPDVPDPPGPSEFGFIELLPTWLATVPANSRGNKTAIRDALLDLADAARDGKFATIPEIEQAGQTILGQVVTDKLGWAVFGQQFMGRLNALRIQGRIKTVADYARALDEVAEGLN